MSAYDRGLFQGICIGAVAMWLGVLVGCAFHWIKFT